MREATHSSTPHRHHGQQRAVTSCLTCRSRKVKCDHGQPVCSACKRGGRACTYLSSPSHANSISRRTGSGAHRIRHGPQNGRDEIRTRLDRLERLLEEALGRDEQRSPISDIRETQDEIGPASAVPIATSSASANRETISTDNYDGALLLDAGTGQSRWVSSLHYALLADQIRDVKMLLGEQIDGETTAASPPRMNYPSPPFPLPGGSYADDLTPWLPSSPEECFDLLETFISNVDPMTRIVHKPSLRARFTQFVHQVFRISESDLQGHSTTPNSSVQNFEPLAFAIFYAAINSLTSELVSLTYKTDKASLLAQFRSGIELGLGQQNFLTTTSIEVLQAFVLFLTCQSREDDMAKTWALLGLAARIALSQGLHREPSFFPSQNMDVVQIELRRRLWHQLCHLDFRSAESTGQEPTISDEDYTTLLPRNISDDDLTEGVSPSPQATSAPGFTDMSGHLIRLHGFHNFRNVVRKTYMFERRLRTAATVGDRSVDPVAEFHTIFTEVQEMINQTKTYTQTEYLAFCNPQIPEHRLTLGLAVVIEWRCWAIFWLRTPKQFRESMLSSDTRHAVLASSVSLVEGLTNMTKDQDAKQFQWHIDGHAGFQAMMHIISELETQESTASALRTRALTALQAAIEARSNETSPTWKAMTRIVSNCLRKFPSHLSTSPPEDSTPSAAAVDGRHGSDTSEQQDFLHDPLLANYAPRDVFADFTNFDAFHAQSPPLDLEWLSGLT